jgi:hypothetical protein
MSQNFGLDRHAVEVQALQRPDAPEPTVIIALQGDTGALLRLAPDEARELCDLIQLTLGQIGA